jgi:hypothetical protein
LLHCYRHPAHTLKRYMTWPTVPWLLEWRTRLTMVSLWRYQYALNLITDIWITLANDVYFKQEYHNLLSSTICCRI